MQRKLPSLTVWVLYIIRSRCTEKTASDKSTPPTPTTQRKKSELRHYASRKQKDSQDYSRNMASADSTAFQNQHCPGGQAMTTLCRRPSTALHASSPTDEISITGRSVPAFCRPGKAVLWVHCRTLPMMTTTNHMQMQWTRLQRVSGNETAEQKQHIDKLAWAGDRCKAWCYRAALASAWVAYAHCAGIRKSWATLKGGLWAEGDLPTWRSKGSLVGGPPIQKPGSTRYLVVKYKQHASPVCSGDYGRDGAGW